MCTSDETCRWKNCARSLTPSFLLGGAEQPRDLHSPGTRIQGHSLRDGVSAAAEQALPGRRVGPETEILATGKNVVIIGGGDTGADCLGTCHRQKALSVHQFEIMPMPPDKRSPQTPWPLWPMQLRIEAAHEEGGKRDWSVATTSFSWRLQRKRKAASRRRKSALRRSSNPFPAPSSQSDADLVLIAMGFRARCAMA